MYMSGQLTGSCTNSRIVIHCGMSRASGGHRAAMIAFFSMALRYPATLKPRPFTRDSYAIGSTARACHAWKDYTAKGGPPIVCGGGGKCSGLRPSSLAALGTGVASLLHPALVCGSLVEPGTRVLIHTAAG